MGGSAEVYSGTDKDNKKIAIKIPEMKFNVTIEAAIIEKFEKEAGIWRNLDHNNIVKFYRADDQPILHIVMELMDGGSLRQLMKGHRLSEGESVQIMFQILEGLSYAHRMATVHRDIKPENILFRSNGVAKITDWGIGKFMAAASMSKTVGTKGTVNYSAPEQFDREKFGKVDWQTDIFQTGVMFYEMLTGKNPFSGEDLPEVFGKVTNVIPDPPSSLDPDLPESLDRVVIGAIEKNKKDRWRSADVMLLQLKNAVGGKAVELPYKKEVTRGNEKPFHEDTHPDKNAGQCAQCENFITPENRKLRCKGCKKYFCQECEGWIDKVKEHLGYVVEMKYPLCENCHNRELILEKGKLQDYVYEEKEKKRKEEERIRKEKEWNNWFGMVTRENAVHRQNGWSERLHLPVRIIDKLGMKFVLIPPGEFWMGSTLWKDSQPVRKVRITNPFYMGIAPLTQGEWNSVWGSNPSNFKEGKFFKRGFLKTRDKSDHPVESVSWSDCHHFISKLNRMYPGDLYRLPTEAEWEYASRAGSDSLYCFGHTAHGLHEYGWFRNNSHNKTHAVGKMEPNDWGLHDVHGNVWEWCHDHYLENTYESTITTDPWGPGEGPLRVIRGGCWDSIATRCSSGRRDCRIPDYRNNTVGLRLVCFRGIKNIQ